MSNSSGDRKLQQRQCLLCRNRAEKETMLRLVVDDEGQLWPDLFQKAPGRGAYLCMEKECFARLSDKRLGALKRNFSIQLPQRDQFVERLQKGLHQQLMRLFSQHRAVAVVGRDAVMHQMWKNGTLLVLLAADAGDALLRQVSDAAGKRQESGQETLLVQSFPGIFLAEAFGRDKVSVAVLDKASVSAKLQYFCRLYELADSLRKQ